MTVIAWDSDFLVADGRATIGDELYTDQAIKIRPVEHPKFGELYGAFCGALCVIDPWIEHIAENGFTPFELPDDDLETMALLVKPNGKAIELMTNGLYISVTTPSAYGSGSTVAQAHLNDGATALEAVRASARYYTSCGGRILAWDWRSRKFRSYAK